MDSSNLRIQVLITIATLMLSFHARGDEPVAADKKSDAPKRPDIYDRAADGEKQIAEALAKAKRDHKRVLLKFGANWCGWCHKLHDLFKSDKDIGRKLLYEYEVVYIDVDKVDGKPHNAATVEKYGQPTKHGLPVLVVLDEDGKQLTTQETGSLEKGPAHDPAKVMAFLDKWKAEPADADALLAAGLAQAKKESRAVFVDFSAPWCGWCRELDKYLHRADVAPIFDSAFVTVKIDVDRFKDGKEWNARHGGDQAGLPFIVILDADGKRLADGFAKPGQNIGCPVAPEEVAHFIKIIRQTAPKLSDEQIATLEKGLKRKTEPRP
ncbi:MAG TPA: thioredoxin family protein [Phycisphaerae bacterium]|nr:thioredoxin family protein [Phycisphaerae bacterium]